MNYFLDTNVIVAMMNGTGTHIVKKISQKRRGNFFLSSITCFELWFGVWNSSRINENTYRLENILRFFQIKDFSQEDATLCGKLRHDLRKSGIGIGQYDFLIAGQVLSHDGILVTANVKELSRIKGLRIENWMS